MNERPEHSHPTASAGSGRAHRAGPRDHAHAHGARSSAPYRNFVWMLLLMFLAMFALMYAMVDGWENVYLLSLNQAYMALLMTGAMAAIELVVMRKMYPNRRWNAWLIAASTLIAVLSWVAIRQQTGINDTQFLRSMIPHHAGALLMCEQSPANDARIRSLCREIQKSQQREIDLMKQLLVEKAE